MTSEELVVRAMTDNEATVTEPGSEPEAGPDDGDAPQIDLEVLNSTLEYIRPALQADGGDLILLGADGPKVTLQLVGACGGCPMSTMTLTAGIERILRDRVPGVEEVVAI